MFKRLYRESVELGFNFYGVRNSNGFGNEPNHDYVIVFLGESGIVRRETKHGLVELLPKNGKGDLRRDVIEGLKFVDRKGLYATHPSDGTKVVGYHQGSQVNIVQITLEPRINNGSDPVDYWRIEFFEDPLAAYNPRDVMERIKQKL